MRLVKKAEAAFNVMPDTISTFDHFTPSAWLIGNLKGLEGDAAPLGTTLDRAEKLFTALNASSETP